MRAEAALHGVRVSALCPGVVRTPILTGGIFGRNVTAFPLERGRALWERLFPMEPGPFARAALAAVARDGAVLVVPRWARAVLLLFRLAPRLEEAMHRREYARLVRDRPEIEQPASAPAGGGA